MPQLFIPAKPSVPVIWGSRVVLRRILKRAYSCTDIVFRPEEIRELRKLSHDRVLLAPNHPMRADPAVMFALAAKVNQVFHFMSNREQFNRSRSYRWLLTRCGAYSIARGVADRESLIYTKSLLLQPDAKLVIFPEGGNYSRSDVVFPFQPGVFSLVRSACDELSKRGEEGPLWVQPVALKYFYERDIEAEIDQALSELELAVGLDPRSAPDELDRFVNIGEAIISSFEKHYRMRPREDDLFDRAERVICHMIEGVEAALGLPKSGQSLDLQAAPVRTRELLMRFYGLSHEESATKTEYERNLLMEEFERMRMVRSQLQRLENWIALERNYLRSNPTPERKADYIMRFQREVYGKVQWKVPRICYVRLAKPLDAREFLSGSGKQGPERLAQEVEARVQSLLDEISKPS
jgi:hypothetical protein